MVKESYSKRLIYGKTSIHPIASRIPEKAEHHSYSTDGRTCSPAVKSAQQILGMDDAEFELYLAHRNASEDDYEYVSRQYDINSKDEIEASDEPWRRTNAPVGQHPRYAYHRKRWLDNKEFSTLVKSYRQLLAA